MEEINFHILANYFLLFCYFYFPNNKHQIAEPGERENNLKKYTYFRVFTGNLQKNVSRNKKSKIK